MAICASRSCCSHRRRVRTGWRPAAITSSSDGDQPEKQIRGLQSGWSVHAAMSTIYSKPQARPSLSNRVTIFVVSNQSEVGKVAGTDNRFLAGFYDARAGISVAVIPESAVRSGLSGETVLYHEYAHHFMSGLTARTYPRWFVEGFAEFFGGVRFGADGTVRLGTPPQHRYTRRCATPRLSRSAGCSISMAAPAMPEISTTRSTDRAGCCSTDLQMEPDRAGQLSKYEKQLRYPGNRGGRGCLRESRPAGEGHEVLPEATDLPWWSMARREQRGRSRSGAAARRGAP